MMWTKSRNALIIAALLVLAPCRAVSQNVAKLIVAPSQFRLETGAKGQIVVELMDELSRAIASEKAGVRFTSTDTNIVAVSVTGAVRAAGVGRAEIVVRAGAQSRRIPVIVEPSTTAPVANTQPAPPTTAPVPSAPPASTQPPVQQPVQQPVQPPVTAVPAATAPAPGAVVMSASIEPVNIQLLPTERFRPTFRLHYADGSQAESRDVVWNAFGAAIAIDPNSGEVIGVAPGSGVLGGRFGNSNTSASVTVTVVEPNLVPTPDSLVIVAGAQDTVSLVVPAQARRRVTQNLVWKSTDPAILRVLNPSAGIVQALSMGNADLIVDGYGVVRRVPVTVTPRIARVETALKRDARITVGTGSTMAVTASPIGTDGAAVSSAYLSWQTADTSIARVDASGSIVGGHAGETTVTLSAPGLEPMVWPVTVQPARVSLGVDRLGAPVGTTRKLTALIRGLDGHEFGAATSARWSSTAPAIASIDASGVLTALKSGRTTITVSHPGAGADTVAVFVTGRGLVSGTIGGVRALWQLVQARDTTPTLLLESTNAVLSQAVWSPDRTRIAATFEPLDKKDSPQVVMFDADGNNMKPISPDTVFASDPSWSADGRSILMAVRDPKMGAILRVAIDTRAASVVVFSPESRYRYPWSGADSSTVIVRTETGGVADVGRVRNGSVQLLTTGRPREELLAPLRDGRVLLAVDSSSRTRPSTLQWVTLGDDGAKSATAVRVPPGLEIRDISAGYDDATVIVVARARSWPGASGAAIVVLRIALDGAEPTLLLLLSEKDSVTVRSN